MARQKLSPCAYVTLGYGQVEPNHLSAQRTGQLYAQLPAAAAINVLENGQFAKYDYANGVVNFTGLGEWMLVYNEPKVYNDFGADCDFALVKTDYAARVYSPVDGANFTDVRVVDWRGTVTGADPYVIDSTADPMHTKVYSSPKAMPTNTTMVPRLFKTNVGDLFTTNTLAYGLSGDAALAGGEKFAPDGANSGYLTKVDTSASAATSTTSKVLAEASQDMIWQVVKVYTMPDGQKGVKLMRIK